MQVYEIYIPELGTYVKFKHLAASDVGIFVQDLAEVSREDYIQKVLEMFVFNMRTEIRESLKMMSRDSAKQALEALFNGCVMLNPGLDIETWVSLAYSSYIDPNAIIDDGIPLNQDIIFPDSGNSNAASVEALTTAPKKSKPRKINKAKFLNLKRFLEDRVVGQNEAIEVVVNALKRSQVGLNDDGRPLGVFLFSGSSGVGKTHLARELHKYLYGDNTDLVRIDCGEYQHKHDNQKLTGSPPGYVGHDDGGQLSNAVISNPDTVVLLDEVEKAHVDIWNTFLRVFDEGILTDSKGRKVDFRNTIIIMTTNLGNDRIVEHLTGGGTGFNARTTTSLSTKDIPSRGHVERVVNESVKKMFKPEFLNRIDQTVVFNYLDEDSYSKVAELEVHKIEEKLSKKGIVLKWDESVLDLLVNKGVDSIRGARGMSHVRREKIENLLADRMISSKIVRGTIIELSASNDDFDIEVIAPKPKRKANGEQLNGET